MVDPSASNTHRTHCHTCVDLIHQIDIHCDHNDLFNRIYHADSDGYTRMYALLHHSDLSQIPLLTMMMNITSPSISSAVANSRSNSFR